MPYPRFMNATKCPSHYLLLSRPLKNVTYNQNKLY